MPGTGNLSKNKWQVRNTCHTFESTTSIVLVNSVLKHLSYVYLSSYGFVQPSGHIRKLSWYSGWWVARKLTDFPTPENKC